MKTDYITSGSTLPPYHGLSPVSAGHEYPADGQRSLRDHAGYDAELRGRANRRARAAVSGVLHKTIAEIIDRTSSTVAQSLRELEAVGLVEKKLIALHTPYHIYIKLPAGENEP